MLNSVSGGRGPRPSAQLSAAGRHANHETLALYVLGDLSVRATLATQEHLSSCMHCKNKLPEVQAVIAALRPAAA